LKGPQFFGSLKVSREVRVEVYDALQRFTIREISRDRKRLDIYQKWLDEQCLPNKDPMMKFIGERFSPYYLCVVKTLDKSRVYSAITTKGGVDSSFLWYPLPWYLDIFGEKMGLTVLPLELDPYKASSAPTDEQMIKCDGKGIHWLWMEMRKALNSPAVPEEFFNMGQCVYVSKLVKREGILINPFSGRTGYYSVYSNKYLSSDGVSEDRPLGLFEYLSP